MIPTLRGFSLPPIPVRLLFAAALALVLPITAYAQANGNVAGRVTDGAGNPIAGATVTVISIERGVSRDTRTNAEGDYMLRGFRPEMYVVRVEADGYMRKEQQVKINFGLNTVDVPLPLQPDADVDYDELNGLYNAGFEAFQARDWEAAGTALRPLITELDNLDGPEVERMRGSALDILGQSELMLGNADAALAVFEQRLERNPEIRASVLPWLAQAHAAREDFESSAELYREAVLLLPDDAGLHYNAAVILMQQQLDAEAIPIMARAIELRPEFPAAHKQIGYAYLRISEYEQSIAAFKLYLEQAPEAEDRPEIEGMIGALEAQIQG